LKIRKFSIKASKVQKFPQKKPQKRRIVRIFEKIDFYLEKTNVIGLGEMRKALKHNLF
jgi:hypothetical protein